MVNTCLAKCLNSVLNQEKALVGAYSVITNLRTELFEALKHTGMNIRGSYKEEIIQGVSIIGWIDDS